MGGEGARRRLVDGDPAGVRPGTRRVLGKSYDMQRVADRLNRYEQFMTTIDGVDIRLLHVRSPVQGATPCVMTHGWPGSVIEFIKVIDPLVDPVSHGGGASAPLAPAVPPPPGHGLRGQP